MNIKNKKTNYFIVLFATTLISCTHSKIEYRLCEKGCVEFRTTKFSVDTAWGTPHSEEEIRNADLREKRWAEEERRIDSIQKSSKEVFIVNSSSDTKYIFTVKISDNSKTPNITTKTFKLNPGEQSLIDCDKYVIEDTVINRVFEIVGEVKTK